jgi:hypothetical protein
MFPYLYPPGTGWPSYTPGTGFLLHRVLQLAGLRSRYSNPPPHSLMNNKSDCATMDASDIFPICTRNTTVRILIGPSESTVPRAAVLPSTLAVNAHDTGQWSSNLHPTH